MATAFLEQEEPGLERATTGPQTLYPPSTGDNVLPVHYPVQAWYRHVRQMRRDPTISLVRNLMIAPALLGPWSVEVSPKAPKGARELIRESLFPSKPSLVRTALQTAIDFGWAPFEKIFGLNEDGFQTIKKMKPLLVDHTEILASYHTGEFLGFKLNPLDRFEQFVLRPNSFLHSIDVEGTDWYGQAPMLSSYEPWADWRDANKAAKRYDTKIAGAQWIIQHPDGKSIYNGVETPNQVIADEVLKALQASGGITVPRRIAAFISDLNVPKAENVWDIDLKHVPAATAAGFENRLKYIDNLKVRGLGFPERSVLEGKFGTKAEAEQHADFAIAIQELRHDDLIRDINWHIINQILRLNWGPGFDNSVWIVRGPIADASRQFLQDFYMEMLSDPKNMKIESLATDRKVLRSILQVPVDEPTVEKMDGAKDDIVDQEIEKMVTTAGQVFNPVVNPDNNSEGDEDAVLDEDGSGE